MKTMDTEKKQFKGGLRPLPKDSRDFSYSKVFGTIEELPVGDFMVEEPLRIKDQGSTDLCTAFGGCAVSELQEGVELSPEWQFAKIKQIEGDWESWGANLRDVCRSLVKAGSIEKKHSPFELE